MHSNAPQLIDTSFVNQLLLIFNSCGAVFFPSLILILIGILSPPVIAQPTPTTQHQELFLRAYKSMAFFTYMAKNDSSFTKTLTESELKMLNGVFSVAMENTTLYWLNENNVQRNGKPGAYFYEYTLDSNNFQIKKVRPLSKTFDRPQYEVAYIAKKPKGSDLELYFTVKGDRQINLDNRIATSELWPELKIKIGNAEVIIRASNY